MGKKNKKGKKKRPSGLGPSGGDSFNDDSDGELSSSHSEARLSKFSASDAESMPATPVAEAALGKEREVTGQQSEGQRNEQTEASPALEVPGTEQGQEEVPQGSPERLVPEIKVEHEADPAEKVEEKAEAPREEEAAAPAATGEGGQGVKEEEPAHEARQEESPSAPEHPEGIEEQHEPEPEPEPKPEPEPEHHQELEHHQEQEQEQRKGLELELEKEQEKEELEQKEPGQEQEQEKEQEKDQEPRQDVFFEASEQSPEGPPSPLPPPSAGEEGENAREAAALPEEESRALELLEQLEKEAPHGEEGPGEEGEEEEEGGEASEGDRDLKALALDLEKETREDLIKRILALSKANGSLLGKLLSRTIRKEPSQAGEEQSLREDRVARRTTDPDTALIKEENERLSRELESLQDTTKELEGIAKDLHDQLEGQLSKNQGLAEELQRSKDEIEVLRKEITEERQKSALMTALELKVQSMEETLQKITSEKRGIMFELSLLRLAQRQTDMHFDDSEDEGRSEPGEEPKKEPAAEESPVSMDQGAESEPEEKAQPEKANGEKPEVQEEAESPAEPKAEEKQELQREEERQEEEASQSRDAQEKKLRDEQISNVHYSETPDGSPILVNTKLEPNQNRTSLLISDSPVFVPPKQSSPTSAFPAPQVEIRVGDVVALSESSDDEDALISKTRRLLSQGSTQEPAPKPKELRPTSEVKLPPLSDEERAQFERAAILVQKHYRGNRARKLTKLAIIRKHIAKEILETEESFVNQLRFLVIEYMAKFGRYQGNDSPITQEQWNDLFSFAPGVLEYNSELLKVIRDRVTQWHIDQKIGDVFVAASSKLANYTNYVNNYNRALTTLHQCQKNSAFVTKCQEVYNSGKIRLTLGDLLIIPIQRIPRYVLLLEQIQKKTPLNHPDRGDLQQAILKLKETAAEINKKKGESQKVQAVYELSQKLTNYPVQKLGELPSPDRMVLLEGAVFDRISPGVFKERTMFLLSDILICTKVNNQQSFFRNVNGYEFKWGFPLFALTMEGPLDREKDKKEDTSSQYYQTSISLLCQTDRGTERRVFAFAKEEDRAEWEAALKAAIDDQETTAPASSTEKRPHRKSVGGGNFFRTKTVSERSRHSPDKEKDKDRDKDISEDALLLTPLSNASSNSSLSSNASSPKHGERSKLPEIIQKMEAEKKTIDSLKRELSEFNKKGKSKAKDELSQKLADAHKNFDALQKEASSLSKGTKRLSGVTKEAESLFTPN